MKTAELTGALLDYWVARAEGSTDAKVEQWDAPMCISSHGAFEPVPFRPSTNWHDCGPLIEKYDIELQQDSPGNWFADSRKHGSGFEDGATPQEAICRAVVRALYGDEVPEVEL